MKKYLYSAVFALSSLASPLVFGQEGSGTGESIVVTPLVNPSSVQTSLQSTLTSWLTVGLSIGIAVFVVYAGWRILRRFIK